MYNTKISRDIIDIIEGNHTTPSRIEMTLQVIIGSIAMIAIILSVLSTPYLIYINYEKFIIIISGFNIDQYFTIRYLVVTYGIYLYIVSLLVLTKLLVSFFSSSRKDLGEDIPMIIILQFVSFLCFLLHN